MSQSSQHTIAGFVPAYNSVSTVSAAVRSLHEQESTSLDVLVIDDASIDGTEKAALEAGAQVITMAVNSGRGAVRARGIEMLNVDFIVSLDAGNQASPDFVTQAMPYFDDPMVAAVVGDWSESKIDGLAQRWRARHLFKLGRQREVGRDRHLSTHGCILRRSAILSMGNFDPTLRHSEDAALGWRLQQRGFRIVSCSKAKITPQIVDRLPALIRRYWRWHAGPAASWSLKHYFEMTKNAVYVMAPLDWKARDLSAFLLTLLLPHWIALHIIGRKLCRKPLA